MIANHEANRYRELADFLKTRRKKILPSQVGLAPAARRRTPGLRREEVAQLAGIGVTWYTWLEQGRPIHVSTQVIESLSRVLLLDRQERDHLYLLANQPLPLDIPAYESPVSPVLQHFLDSLLLSPSMLMDQRWNVIAWNRAACFLFGDFNSMSFRERNMIWAMFTDLKYRQMYPDWNLYAKGLLGRFRAACGRYLEDAWLAQFIEELKTCSAEFDAWWQLHEIESSGEVYKHLVHPIAGRLDFEVSNFDVSDGSGLKLVIHTPSPGTDTTEKMMSALRG